MQRVFLGGLVVGLLSCAQRAKNEDAVRSDPAKIAPGTQPRPRFHSDATFFERSGLGQIRYLGFDMTPAGVARAGDVVELAHVFFVDVPMKSDCGVIVELREPGAHTKAVVMDAHRPIEGRVPTNLWRAGEGWVDRHKIRLPKEIRTQSLEVFVALSNAGRRIPVEAWPGKNDGTDFVRAATIAVERTEAVASAETPHNDAARDTLAQVTIGRTNQPVSIDGVLSEPAWNAASRLTMSDSLGRNVPTRFPTTLRLLYDDEHLYVAFEANDVDISDPFLNRDDPIYDHEAVELFLMPNVRAPHVGPYVELQASPNGVIFDAAFTARRQGMDKSFNANQIVATVVDGTLNDPKDRDRGWVSEWRVPWKSVRGVSAPPSAGDEWRMNAFRIEKFRENGREDGEYTAWSPPQVGDFHNVERFGRLVFGP